MRRIYLDHAATTRLDERVLEAMMPFLREHYGNPSSVHSLGRKARFAVEESREKVADLLGAEPGEIVFTSGGTEANNAAIRGMSGGLLTSAAEHESVLRPAEALRSAGRDVEMLSPDASGAVRPSDLAARLDAMANRADETAGRSDDGVGLVSIMHANNEVGTLSPLRDVIACCHARGLAVHCDAVQTAGYGMIRVDDVEVDLMTVSGHKFYGPKGVGVLFVRGGVSCGPLLHGGQQERGRRGGTENVPAVVGFARALELAFEEADDRRRQAAAMRERLRTGLAEAVGEHCRVVTPSENMAAPHILNVVVPPVDGRPIDGEMLLLGLDMEGIQVSSGSACTSGTLEPSHVLLAMGVEAASASAAVRFSVGKDTTAEEVELAVDAFERVVRRMTRMPAAR